MRDFEIPKKQNVLMDFFLSKFFKDLFIWKQKYVEEEQGKRELPKWLSWPGLYRTEAMSLELYLGLLHRRVQASPSTWAIFCFIPGPLVEPVGSGLEMEQLKLEWLPS